MCVCVCVCVCVCSIISSLPLFLLNELGGWGGGIHYFSASFMLNDVTFKVLFAEMNVNVVFVIRCLYSAVSLTLVKE